MAILERPGKLYPCTITEHTDDNHYFFISFRDVPEALSQAYSLAEALEMAEDALKCALEMYKDDGDPYPEPSAFRHGDVLIKWYS